MRTFTRSTALFCALGALLSLNHRSFAVPKDLGGGFTDYGVAVPISNHRGTVATVDGDRRKVLLMWLMDHRGGYSLLMVDVETGKSEQFPIPFKNVKEDSPYASILSSANKFYTHYGDYFVEFDPVKRAFTFCSKTTPQMGMGMTEDDNGVIWSVAYPQSALVSFDPKSRKFTDYGNVYTQNWPQYQRYVAADDAGWIYFAVGQTASQIVAFDPQTTKTVPLLNDKQRATGTAYVYRDLDGKVYGQAVKGGDGTSESQWLQLYKGVATPVGAHRPHPKPIVTGRQEMFFGEFPDGTRVTSCDLAARKMTVRDGRTSSVREVAIDYTSEGAIVMGVAVSPNNLVCGGTAFPMRFFSLDTATNELSNRPAHGQWNTVARTGDRFFVGGYPTGFLLEWDPSRPWVNTEPSNPASNPAFLTKVLPTVYRPHSLLPMPDGKTVIMGGTPDYGYTGGGLLFWDRQTSSQVVLKDTDLIPNQSTMSMVPIGNGKVLAGTTVAPGTGGEQKAREAELYVLDVATKKMEWHARAIPGIAQYMALLADDGVVYGFGDRKKFFVFDPVNRQVLQQQDTQTSFGITAYQQGPRVFVQTPEKKTYVLFSNCIAELDTAARALKLVTKAPVGIECGGDYLNGRIYFAAGSHICSYEVVKGTQ